MTQLAGLRFYLQQTSDNRQLSLLPTIDYFTGLPHQLPSQRQELVITIAHALPTGFCLGLRRAAELQQAVNHGRAGEDGLLEMSRAAKSQTEAGRQRMRDSYYKLLALTGKLVRQAGEIVDRWQKRKLPVIGSLLKVEAQTSQLRHFLPLVEKVIAQTKERVWKGNRHVAGKVLSLFESHTQVIRKGKAHRPNEFGRLVRIDEVENGIVS